MKTILYLSSVLMLLGAVAGHGALPPGAEEANLKAVRDGAALELDIKVTSVSEREGFICAEGLVVSVDLRKKNAGFQDISKAPRKGDKVRVQLRCETAGGLAAPGSVSRESCSRARQAAALRLWRNRVDFTENAAAGCARADADFKITAYKGGTSAENTLYGFTVKDSRGKDYSLAALKGKVALIVNVASNCGFTPQYEGLEALYKRYSPQGLVVLGFPCNQFGGQEPGSNEQIRNFCRLNYGVTFPVMDKIEVNGKGAHPLYVHLKAAAPGGPGSEAIEWNFTKFLVDREGRVISRYAPRTKPEALAPDIEKALGLKSR
jgi:glutathione peroxidase